MKVIAIFYRNRINYSAIQYIEDNLYSVLEGYVHIQNYFLDELAEFQKVKADAYLVLYEEMLPLLVRHVEDFSKVIVITRSIKRRYIEPIMKLPPGRDVLVVNDSRESILQTVFILYEVGIGHLNLIPYDPDLDARGEFAGIRTAIVAQGSEHLIPAHIQEVINIRNRDVSFVTIQNIIRLLHLENTPAQATLLRKVQDDLDTGSTFIENYLSNYLKDQLLLIAVGHIPAAILLLERNGVVHYVNEKAHAILDLMNGDSVFDRVLPDPLFTDEKEYRDQVVQIEGDIYLVTKTAIDLAGSTIGFSVVMQSEKNLRDREAELNEKLRTEGLYACHSFSDIVSRSAAMNRSLEEARRIATSEFTVLIRGESGTGKELVAQSIHNHSRRKNGPFVAINCAALPETLLESELFGYEPGSFTGAKKEGKVGLFERAQGGTIFLDEIGDISPSMQAQLLRVTQEKQIMRIGSDRIINIDVRIIAATNADLEKKIEAGTFRRDLYYRLNVLPLTLLPLRDRRADILPLLHGFLGTNFARLSDAEKKALERYDWPGNVRELENFAHYYETLHTLPVTIMPHQSAELPGQPAEGAVERPLSEDDVSFAILRCIAEASYVSLGGIGRVQLQSDLADAGLKIGEGRLRKLLAELAGDGLIKIRTGRAGTRITEAGLQKLGESK